MTPLAKLSGTLSIALPPRGLGPATCRRTSGAHADRCRRAADRELPTQTSVSVTAAVTPGHSIADSGAMSEWLSAIGSKAVLLSFIDTSEQSTDGPDNPDMSRRLLVFIRSVRTQHSTGRVGRSLG